MLSVILALLLCTFHTVYLQETKAVDCQMPTGEHGECVTIAACKGIQGAHSVISLGVRLCAQRGNIGVICCPDSLRELPMTTTTAHPESHPLQPSSLPTDCGTPNALFPRIVGGTDAKPRAWPWMVLILRFDKNVWQQYCAGSLISSRHVIIAAKCFASGLLLRLSSFKVRLGEPDVVTDDKLPEEARIERGVSSIRTHDDFDPNVGTLYDIALLTMDKEVDFNVYIQPVCLPDSSMELENITSRTVFLSSWGTVKRTSIERAQIRQQAQFSVWDHEKCKQKYADFGPDINEKFVLCAADPRRESGSCDGDFGAP